MRPAFRSLRFALLGFLPVILLVAHCAADSGPKDTGNGTPDGIVFQDTGVDSNDTGIGTDTGSDTNTGSDTSIVAGPGEFGYPCLSNIECISGFCVPSVEGKVCTEACSDECPAGWNCRSLDQPGLESIHLCLDIYVNLCRPCNLDLDCQTGGGSTTDRCMFSGDLEGSFCGIDCSDGLDCPEGYSCNAFTDPENEESFAQCMPNTGVCSCSPNAINDDASTACGTDFCQGQRICTDTGLTECSAAKPGEEMCDGIDNDCNGETDEVFGTSSCGLGVCEHTIDVCSGGQILECDPFEGASAETCDALDNNCDGTVDEDLGELNCGLGACEKTVDACQNGVIQFCSPFEGASDEVCDGVDNDCDGALDEDQGTSFCGVGVCHHTIDNCVGGIPQICDAFQGSGTEVCDGLDNDCNGSVDEELGSDTCGLGECAHTVPSCVDQVPQFCNPFEGAVPEICDGLDNNCNGLVDDQLGTASCGFGPCAHTVYNCENGEEQTCDPLAGASEEICDGLDNDCSGLIDDNLGTSNCGVGECLHVIANCVGGIVPACNTHLGSAPEQCDGKDNDCNGEVDEGLEDVTCGEGVCQQTLAGCVDGNVPMCIPLENATAEICDGLDNDCDGQPDENLGETTCGVGACLHTVENCVGGSDNICDPLEGKVDEICPNGIDDDCDGEIDEGCFVPPTVGTTGTIGVVSGTNQWIVCRADNETAWISSLGGGGSQYDAAAICVHLGYTSETEHGGNGGNVCTTPETYDEGGESCGYPPVLCYTVDWKCSK